MENQMTNPEDIKQTIAALPEQASSFRKKTYIIVIIAALILLISSLLLVSTSQKTQKPSVVPSPIQPTEDPTPIPTIAAVTSTTLTTTEKNTLAEEIRPALKDLVDITFTIQSVKSYGEEWAVVQIANPTTDPASVVVKKENGSWVVKLGPGTYFDAEELQAISAPQNLIQEINGGI